MQKLTTLWIAQNAPKIHNANADKGFYDAHPPREQRLKSWPFLLRIANLINEEIMELYSAIRDGKISPMPEFLERIKSMSGTDYFLFYAANIKGTAAEELADIVIRACDFLGSVCEGFAELQKLILGNTILPADYNFDAGVQKLRHNTTFIDSKHTGLFSCALNHKAAQLQLQTGVFILIENVQLMAEFYQIDLLQAVQMKLRYNLSRPHKHGKNF